MNYCQVLPSDITLAITCPDTEPEPAGQVQTKPGPADVRTITTPPSTVPGQGMPSFNLNRLVFDGYCAMSAAGGKTPTIGFAIIVKGVIGTTVDQR
ncbi:hypothetical protein N7513_003759 [Penicillium frequentans]|nr:hypothetical protein N7513_003759 [Penicillium glabrum]